MKYSVGYFGMIGGGNDGYTCVYRHEEISTLGVVFSTTDAWLDWSCWSLVLREVGCLMDVVPGRVFRDYVFCICTQRQLHMHR